MTLEQLVTVYGEQNDALKNLKKTVDNLKAKIKTEFLENNLVEKSSGKYVVKKTIIKSENFDEDKLINLLQRCATTTDYNKIVKTKEYVDMDALEDAIYNGKIDPKNLVAAKTTKLIEKITCKEIKGADN